MSEPKPPSRPPETARASSPEGAEASLGPERAYLTVIRGDQDLGVCVEVESATVIGRAPEAICTLQDLGVSREHARICTTAAGEYVLEDLGSTNGTRVNGRPLEGKHLLFDGDKIVVGESILRFGVADDLDLDLQSEIGTLVGTDPLTGLASKRRFDDALDFGIKVAARESQALALLMLDLDGVRQINDTHGRRFGAHAIGEAGRILALHLGSDGHAARLGGDEFCALLPGRDKERACRVAEHIRQAVETANMQKDGILLKPTISIGVGVFPPDAGGSLDLVAYADAALHRAKAAGKNCVRT